jgi:hypothetical protein
MIQIGLHLTQINSQGTPISTTPELLQHPMTSQGLLGHLLGHLVMSCQAPVTSSVIAFHHLLTCQAVICHYLGTIQAPCYLRPYLVLFGLY